MEMALTDRLKRLDRTLLELITGICVFGLACQSAALPFSINQVKFATGLWMGILIAFFSAVHMWRSLNKAFMCDEKSAARLLAGGYLMRYLITGVFPQMQVMCLQVSLALWASKQGHTCSL